MSRLIMNHLVLIED